MIERALKIVFSGIKVNERNVQFSYGTQRELNQWIANRNTNQKAKFPLIWFVFNDYREHNSTFYVDNARIIVFMNTEYNWLNETREVKTYETWIEPTVKEVIKRLTKTQHVKVNGQNDKERFKYRNIRNYGVSVDTNNNQSSNSFNSSQSKSQKSITTDIVDATTIDFDIELKANCII